MRRHGIEWDELFATTTTERSSPDIDERIRRAIGAKRLITLTLANGTSRARVEPHVYGERGGAPILLIYDGWHGFISIAVSTIDAIQILDETFHGRRTLPAEFDPDK